MKNKEKSPVEGQLGRVAAVFRVQFFNVDHGQRFFQNTVCSGGRAVLKENYYLIIPKSTRHATIMHTQLRRWLHASDQLTLRRNMNSHPPIWRGYSKVVGVDTDSDILI